VLKLKLKGVWGLKMKHQVIHGTGRHGDRTKNFESDQALTDRIVYLRDMKAKAPPTYTGLSFMDEMRELKALEQYAGHNKIEIELNGE
jgi:hypothetical protein